MSLPRGKLVTPVGITVAGKVIAFLIDDLGHLQLDILTSGLPTGASTSANQTTMVTALQLIDDLRTALATVATDQLRVDLVSYPANLDIRDLAHTQDSILGYGKDSGGTARILRTDAEGRLETVNSMHTTAKARAYLSSPQDNIENNTGTKVLLDGETYDPSSIFAANGFTIKVAGYYMVCGQAVYEGASVVLDKLYYTNIYKNDAGISQGVGHSAIANFLAISVSDIRHFDVDDVIELYVYHQAGVDTVDLYNNQVATFLSIHLLSAD